jgi:hypothetical protein
MSHCARKSSHNDSSVRSGGCFLAPATAKQIRQRDRFFTILSHLPARRVIRYLSARTAAAIKLPEYPEPGSR